MNIKPFLNQPILIAVMTIMTTIPFRIFCIENTKRVIGYYISWGMYDAHKNYKPQNIPWKFLTHINYAFAQIKEPDWSIEGTDPWADHQVDGNGQIGMLNELKKEHGVKTLISVGGWTRSGKFSAMASSDEGRTAFAKNCVRFIREYSFDGIDIDWEYPGFLRDPDPELPGDEGCPGKPEDKENFTLLLKKLREVLNTAGKEDNTSYFLTIASPAGYDKIQGPNGLQEPDKYHEYLDWINVMTYDYHGGWDSYTGHSTGLYANPNSPFDTSPLNIKQKYNCDASLKLYRDTYKVPAKKLNLGMAFYGRSLKNVENNGVNGLFQKGEARPKHEGGWEYGTEGFYTLKPWESNAEYNFAYDTIAKACYLYKPSEKLFYTYDNVQSISDKCAYIITENYGGAFFWELTGDYPATGGNTLTSVIHNKLTSSSMLNKEMIPLNPVLPKQNSIITTSSDQRILIKSLYPTPVTVSILNCKGVIIQKISIQYNRYAHSQKLIPGIYFYTVAPLFQTVRHVVCIMH